MVKFFAYIKCAKCSFSYIEYEEQHPDENDADDEDAEKDHTNWTMDLSLACWIGWYVSYILLTFLWLVLFI